jgi:hypothetical protein
MIEYLKANGRDLIVIAIVGAFVVRLALEIVGIDLGRGK